LTINRSWQDDSLLVAAGEKITGRGGSLKHAEEDRYAAVATRRAQQILVMR
jgi:hypothetical protein